jgi:hypothetical protein
MADGSVRWKGETLNKRLLLTCTIFGWDGRKRPARAYALTIETRSSLAPVIQTTQAHAIAWRGRPRGLSW